MAKIRAVTLWGDSWNSLLHIPMDAEVEVKEKRGERFQIEGTTFRIMEIHKSYGPGVVLETNLIEGKLLASVTAAFLDKRGIYISNRPTYLWGSWCFYLNIPVNSSKEYRRLSEELGRELTSEDVEEQIAKLVHDRWYR